MDETSAASDLFAASVLVVDDEAAERRLACAMLEGAGFRNVEATGDPAEVCALHARRGFELIVLDLMMPAMDGFEVMEELRRAQGEAQVLAVASEPDLMRRALASGAADFIAKPLRVAEVNARASGVLQSGRLVRSDPRYRALLERSPAGIYIMENERVLYANPVLCEMVGCELDEVTATGWRGMVLEADRPLVDGVVHRRREGDRSPIEMTCRLRCRDGRIARVHVDSTVVEIDGRVLVVGIVQATA